jgi:hypothetical protein
MARGGSDRSDVGGPPRGEADRRAAFEAAAAIEDETERALEAAAPIAEDLGELGLKPIVVGGLAVAYWTAGVETTGDIDVVVSVSNETLDERLGALGMEPVGRKRSTTQRARRAARASIVSVPPGESVGVRKMICVRP